MCCLVPLCVTPVRACVVDACFDGLVCLTEMDATARMTSPTPSTGSTQDCHPNSSQDFNGLEMVL